LEQLEQTELRLEQERQALLEDGDEQALAEFESEDNLRLEVLLLLHCLKCIGSSSSLNVFTAPRWRIVPTPGVGAHHHIRLRIRY
jgi:hypothetical protein